MSQHTVDVAFSFTHFIGNANNSWYSWPSCRWWGRWVA